jgi:PAS domain S-box-containing protein
MKPRRGDLPIRSIRSASSEKLARAWFKPQEIRTAADSVIMQERNMTHRGTHGLAQVQAVPESRANLERAEMLSHYTFEQAPIGILYADRDGRVLRANSALCNLLGFDSREIETTSIAQFTHEQDITDYAAEYGRLWRGEITAIDVEKRYVRTDRRAVWVRVTTALIRDKNDAPICAVEFLRDISARKDLAASLQQSQRLLQAIIADLPVAVKACDVDGRVFLHNPAAAELFAIEAVDDSSSGPSKAAVEFFLPDGKTPLASEERPLARALRGETVTNAELVIAPPGGGTRITLGSARRLTGENGECLGAVAVTQDVTERKKLELELAQAQKLESIGQLAAGIAHEINTPTQFIGDNIRFLKDSVGEVLGVVQRLMSLVSSERAATVSAEAIAALLESVDMSYFEEEVPKAILQSLDGVERISKIVGAMKEFSHPATDMAPHDLNRAIVSTITVATNEWKYVADVTTDFDADLPPVPVMPGAFNQVILNILVNAAHAIGALIAEAPGTKGLITVSTRKISNWAEIRIQDSGCGIPEEVRDRIFDPFFTTKPVGKGTGQGLAIAHDVIVKKHHGTITVESAPGVGTTFVLRLPLDSTTTDAASAAASPALVA